MYDLPDAACTAATDRLFLAVRATAPVELELGASLHRLEGRDQDAAVSVWEDDRLLLSQICGQNLWDSERARREDATGAAAALGPAPPPAVLVPLASPC